MKRNIHLIMPMAGRGSRFYEHGFQLPKPLITIYGKPFFYWAVQSVRKFISTVSLDFVILQEHDEKYDMGRVILSYFPDARIHRLKHVTKGAVITCRKGMEDISDGLPVIFNDCDHLFKCSLLSDYCNRGTGTDTDKNQDTDGILLTFRSDEPKYSYAVRDESGAVTGTVEKEAASREAVCGCYYFRNSSVFARAADQYLQKCEYSEYFMSGVYNILLSDGQTVTCMETDFHVSFGVPEEYESAKKRTEYEALI